MSQTDTDYDHDVEPDEILPELYARAAASDMEGEPNIEETHGPLIEQVFDVLQDLYEGGVTDHDRLVTFGRRMASLRHYGGLTPSEAKARTAGELFDSVGTTAQDIAELLDMSEGGYTSLRSSSTSKTTEARRLFVMTDDKPVNIIRDAHMAAESPVDAEVEYIFVETVDPRTEATEVPHYNRSGPDPQYLPPEPQYGVYTFIHSYGDFTPEDDPGDRHYGTFTDLQTEWFMDGAELVDAYYEGTYYESEERAATWRDLLTEMGFGEHVESEPRERVNPDRFLDEEENDV